MSGEFLEKALQSPWSTKSKGSVIRWEGGVCMGTTLETNLNKKRRARNRPEFELGAKKRVHSNQKDPLCITQPIPMLYVVVSVTIPVAATVVEPFSVLSAQDVLSTFSALAVHNECWEYFRFRNYSGRLEILK